MILLVVEPIPTLLYVILAIGRMQEAHKQGVLQSVKAIGYSVVNVANATACIPFGAGVFRDSRPRDSRRCVHWLVGAELERRTAPWVSSCCLSC